LHFFILRDVVAIRESLRLEGQAIPLPGETIITVSNFIMRLLFTHEIRQLHLVDALRNFLDAHVLHFCHELYHFANSTYDISDYDSIVQHTYRPLTTDSTVI